MSQFGYGTDEQRVLDEVELIAGTDEHRACVVATVLQYLCERIRAEALMKWGA